RLREVRVFVVAVVLADVDDWQLPELCEVHRLVQKPLPERAFAEETDRDAAVLQILRRVGRASRDARAAADDGVRAEVAGGRVGDVHRAALALAVAHLFAKQFRKHQLGIRALRQAVAVTAMRAGDVVVVVQRFAHADGNRLFPDVEMREARHQRTCVEIVDALLEQANRHHLAIEREQFVLADPKAGQRRVQLIRCRHAGTPDILASTWKIAAKSFSVSPIPLKKMRNSLATDVVGSGTARRRPISSASDVSFCIIFMSNQASSGICSTIGPRYCTIGEAMTLLVRTSTAVLRGMPDFSANKTASENASI